MSGVKLSKGTIDVLKNFSGINSQILVKKGSVLRTISAQKTIMAQATVEDEFPVDFAIYDLPQLLSAIGLFQDPDIEFGDRSLTISGANGVSLRYTYASPENIAAPPSKDIKLPSQDLTAEVTQAQLAAVIKAAGVLSMPEVAIVSDGDDVSLVAGDAKNKSSNQFLQPISHGPISARFTMIYKVENLLRVMPGDYTLNVSSKGLTHLKSSRLQYWIPTESSSKYGE